MICGAGKDSLERSANCAETGRFKVAVIGLEGGIDLFGTSVELLSSIADFAAEIAHHATKGDDEKKENNASSSDFDDGGF